MNIINIGIIAHVDVEKVLFSMPSYALKCHFLERSNNDNLLMDSFDLKQEREITIFSKQCSIVYEDLKVNIVDHPEYADCSSEEERVMGFADTVILK